MNEFMDLQSQLSVSSDQCAKKMLCVMERRQRKAIVPFFWTFLIPILKLIPILFLKRMFDNDFDPIEYEKFQKHTYNK